MKIFLPFFILASIFTAGNAQVVKTDTTNAPLVYPKNQKKLIQSDFMYSIAVSGYSYQQLPKIMNQVNYSDYKSSYLNGLMIKFNDNQISYRLTGYYYKDDISFKNNCNSCEIAKGKLTDYSFKIGFEKNISYSSVQPYFGVDLGYRYNQFQGTSYDFNSGAALYDANAQKNSVVFSPFFGLRYNFVNHFSIGAEAGLDILYSYERQEKTPVGSFPSVNKYNRWEYLLKPLSMITLQYSFGSVY
ncbi:hypothetical protein GS399_14745 [Pedobacter sp. HMF7647]|uniref:Outer membrane beta-barrel protein n=1 Tax=Hufsiella arboris TaxID=2695275 RepID=A0A7K1YCC4_9SPHI|nr:hypothetical protein [Hufsiella arboris]MXV52234.1 hypothetical protein [Hufsiella arboris]